MQTTLFGCTPCRIFSPLSVSLLLDCCCWCKYIAIVPMPCEYTQKMCIQRNSPGFLASAYTVTRHSDERNLFTQKQINFEIRHCRSCCGCVCLYWKRYTHSRGHRHCRWKFEAHDQRMYSTVFIPVSLRDDFPLCTLLLSKHAHFCAQKMPHFDECMYRASCLWTYEAPCIQNAAHIHGAKEERRKSMNKTKSSIQTGTVELSTLKHHHVRQSFIQIHEHAGTQRRRAHRQSHPYTYTHAHGTPTNTMYSELWSPEISVSVYVCLADIACSLHQFPIQV